MNYLHTLFITSFMTVMFFTVMNVAEARTSDAGTINTKAMENTNEGVVSPGTRLMAGNRHKNEFYILGNNEKPPIIKRRVGNIRLALNKIN